MNNFLLNDPVSKKTRCQLMSYDINNTLLSAVQEQLIDGPTVFMFSGSWRLNLVATYIELRMFKECGLKFHKSTLFVEPNESKLFNLVLSKLAPINLVILHSDYWVQHQSVENLMYNLDQLLQYVSPGGQVLCTVPVNHIHFNRLTMSCDDLLAQTHGTLINDSLMLVRK